MTGKAFMNAVANGQTDVVQLLLDLLEETGAAYCVIGGLAVNAYAEPVVSLDVDLVVIASDIEKVCDAARFSGMKVEHFEHRINLSIRGLDLRIQLWTDSRYQDFVSRAVCREVLGYKMNVACLDDVLQGKVWAYSDEQRRKSKRQKDLSDIMRLVETHPKLRKRLPPEILVEVE
ncbi:MAG: hypothetical protein ACE5OR_13615 [bacterium]